MKIGITYNLKDEVSPQNILNDEFCEEFEKYFYETKGRFEAAGDGEKEYIWLDCKDFVFPYIGERFKNRVLLFNVKFSFVDFSCMV